MLNCVFPKPQQWLDARCQIYSRIKNKGFPLKLHKSAKKGKEKVKNSRQIWESWIPPVIFWKLDNHTIEFPKSFHFENLPRNFLKEVKLHPTQQIFSWWRQSKQKTKITLYQKDLRSLPKLPLRTTKAKTYPMWSTWEQEIQNEGRILPD